MAKGTCIVVEHGKICGDPMHGHGFCRRHYKRWYRFGDPLVTQRAANGSWSGCSIPGCPETTPGGRGWCKRHYAFWQRNGDPLVRLPHGPAPGAGARPLADRFWAKVDRRGPTECWPWKGPPDKGGYGHVGDKNRGVGAHRVSYELNVGPIPAGYDVDHLCFNPICVNPAHLEAVTPEENNRRQRRHRVAGRWAPNP